MAQSAVNERDLVCSENIMVNEDDSQESGHHFRSQKLLPIRRRCHGNIERRHAVQIAHEKSRHQHWRLFSFMNSFATRFGVVVLSIWFLC
ncbi:hypothetical protein BDN72DRAFT_284810 [Pluteus cervinus]|uniref:Uncharacterized protein n=1 Tax=Pluteus cervinus TaxID=181527 RepID=A0ACD3AEW0_9AGAR|nr:hypothetical protein BDN72DRAFT_284810 [Pluteus cervinus]